MPDEDSNDLYRATGFKSYSNDNNSEGLAEIPNSIQPCKDTSRKMKRKTENSFKILQKKYSGNTFMKNCD